MASPRGPVSVDVLRETVRRAVSRSSIRPVAKAIGLTPAGLHGLLQGSVPQSRTVRKLQEWYAREGARLDTPDDDTLRNAAALLLDGIGPREWRRTIDDLLEALESGHRRQRTEPPSWIARLRGWERE